MIILFLGWGAEVEPFAYLRKPGYDLMIVGEYFGYDPREVAAALSAAEKEYKEVVIIAWSFGVKIAEDVMSWMDLSNVTLRLAVNGSSRHIDDEFGIPKRIFAGTLAGLTLENMRKFQRRTAGDSPRMSQFFPLWEKSREEQKASFLRLKSELEMFGSMPSAPCNIWNKAVISGCDRIFPAENLRRQWSDIDTYEFPLGSHLPDFQMILDRFVVDKNLVVKQFADASDTYSDHASVQRVVAENLIRELGALPSPKELLEVGCGDGTLTRLYLGSITETDSVTLADVAELGPELISEVDGIGASLSVVEADCESSSFRSGWLQPYSYDLILSSSMLQWLNAPAEMIARFAEALKPGGKCAVTFYIDGTFAEVSRLTGNGLMYPTVEALVKRIETLGCRVISSGRMNQTLRFTTGRDLLAHLKLTGVNALPAGRSVASARRLLEGLTPDHSGGFPLSFVAGYIVFSKG